MQKILLIAYAILIVVGVILTIQIPYFVNVTLIENLPVYLLYIFIGLFFTFIFKKFISLVKYSNYFIFNHILRLILGIIAFGGVVVFSLLYFNFHYANIIVKNVNATIIKTGYLKQKNIKKLKPYAELKIEKLE